MKIINTDNLGGDYPDESFVNIPSLPEEACQSIADEINKHCCHDNYGGRFWKVVEDDYRLVPGFEP